MYYNYFYFLCRVISPTMDLIKLIRAYMTCSVWMGLAVWCTTFPQIVMRVATSRVWATTRLLLKQITLTFMDNHKVIRISTSVAPTALKRLLKFCPLTRCHVGFSLEYRALCRCCLLSAAASATTFAETTNSTPKNETVIISVHMNKYIRTLCDKNCIRCWET